MAKDTLAEYSAKRTFGATPEPRPAVLERRGPLLFVIQQHAARHLHFDLRLECDGVLKSWAVPKGPSLDPRAKHLAMRTEDHPFDYGSFEGVIPAGQYGAGEVIVWDCGVYSPDEGGATWFHEREAAERQVREGIAKGKLSIELRGEKLKGSFALVRTKEAKSWLLLKHRDRFATAEELAPRERSVLSGLSVGEMAMLPAHRIAAVRLAVGGRREAMPAKLEPMQAQALERAFTDAAWSWEPKLDGDRVLAFIDATGVRLRSRRGLELPGAFPQLCAELATQGANGMVLDGVIVEGKASPAVFVCFDLLHFAGIDLRAAPYRDRRRYLAQCLMPSRLVQLVHAADDGVALHAAAIASGFAGVIGKRLDSRYEAGKRSGAWLEVVRPRGDPEPKKVRLTGRSRAGGKPERHADADDVVADVVSQLDNAKSSLTLAVGAHPIKLTNLDRVYWPANPGLKQPALAKRDLVRYLAEVSPFMLPHLADRPLTMIRMPEGIGGQRFFQKHWAQERPAFVETITLFSGHKEESHEYLLCNNLATLVWLAQAGTLEFHVWHSRAKLGADASSKSADYASSLAAMDRSVLNYPDYVVFDIDPYIYSGKEAKGAEPELNTVAFEKGKEVAFHLKELLADMSLEAVVKTSGKTGLHIFVPIRRTLTFDDARHVSEMVGRHLMSKYPKDITLEWKIPLRTGKIFMDYNMNVRGKTLNSAYSPRGEPGAPVSMPLTWEELAGAHPLDFRMSNAAARLARTGDRWKDVFQRKQDLERALRRKNA